MDLIETLRSTGAVRDFLPDAVDDEVVGRILDNARFAPSGGNRQGWRVIVVKDPERRRKLRDIYLPGWYEYLSMGAAGLVPWAPITDEEAERAAAGRAPEVAAKAAEGPGGFAEHLDEVSVLLLVLADLRALAAVDKHHRRYTFAGGASVYPFAWNVLLAARAEGLAGVMTTMPIRDEEAVKRLFDIPDELAVATLIALGRPVHQPTRLRRRTVEEFATTDTWGGTPFATPAG